MYWLTGLHLVLQPVNLIALVLGSAVGLFLGTLPGLGPGFALTLFLPLTFDLSAATSLIFLVSLYTAAVYGGAITAVVVNVPGHPGNIATMFDGHPMARQGRAGQAISAIGVAGTFGGLLALLVLVFLSPLVVDVALRISPADYFMLAVFGLALVSATAGRNVLQGLILSGLGFLTSTVGADTITGAYRFTYGSTYLVSDGISFAVMVVGLFAIGSALLMIEQRGRPVLQRVEAQISGDMWTGVREALRHPIEIIRSSVVGVFMGVVPGLGIALSNIAAYLVESRLNPRGNFGQGNIVGVMAPEAADNATLIAELIPAFTLGIPGAVTSALMLDAVTVHGLQPGPTFFNGNPVIAAFFIAAFLSQIVFAVLGIASARFLAKGSEVPPTILAPVILVMGCVGAYAIHGSIGDIVLALIFGVVGYVILKLELPLAPIVLGAILGPLAEDNYRRAMIIAQATGHSPFAAPLPLTLVILSLLVFVLPVWGQVRDWRRRATSPHP
jgi:putative tricarboxylic transport membrane protein